MAETILVRLAKGQSGMCEWLEGAVLRQGTVTALQQHLGDAPVTLLLAASDVLLLDIELPVRSQRQLQKALPFAVEDRLAGDVEAYHLAGGRQADGRVAVAAVAHEKMQACLLSFREAGIRLSGVYSEVMFLPVRAGGCSVLIEQQHAVLRHGNCQGGGMDAQDLPLVFEKMLDGQSAGHSLYVWTTGSCCDLTLPQNVDIVYEPVASALHFFRANIADNSHLNLLSGPYRQQGQAIQRWRVWLPMLLIMALAAFAQLGAMAYDHRRGQQQLAELKAENERLFKRIFPDVKRIVNLKTQAQQELLALRKQHSSQGSDFLHLLYLSGEMIRRNQALLLQEIGFGKGVLSLLLTADGIASIEQFKQLMENQNSVEVKILSAESNDQGFSARLEISGKRS